MRIADHAAHAQPIAAALNQRCHFQNNARYMGPIGVHHHNYVPVFGVLQSLGFKGTLAAPAAPGVTHDKVDSRMLLQDSVNELKRGMFLFLSQISS